MIRFALGQTPADWPIITRVRWPYTWDPITVDRGAERPPPHAPSDGSDRLVTRKPIHPHLLRLRAGDPESFADYVEEVGLLEFLPWVHDVVDSQSPGLRELVGTYERWRQRILWCGDLEAVWTGPATIGAFDDARQYLRSAYLFATGTPLIPSNASSDVEAAARDLGLVPPDDPREIAALIHELAWKQSTFKIKTWFDSATSRTVEQPAHVFARAWLELLDLLEQGGLTRLCPHCGNPFAPGRSNQKFCQHLCQQFAYDRRANSDPDRREYKKMEQRWRRGTLSDEEWQEYKAAYAKRQRRRAK